MDDICCLISGICCVNLNSCQDRYRRSEFQPGNCNPNHCCSNHGMGMVFLTHAQNGLAEISKKSWIFLILSGLATGASWLCYYKALQMGDASKVVPIDKLSVVITLILAFVFLHEQFTAKSLIGCILIGAGTLIMVL